MHDTGIDPSFDRRRLLGAGAALATGGLWSLPLAAQTGKRRVALVIGNGAYPIGALANPVRDAQGEPHGKAHQEQADPEKSEVKA